MKSHFVTLCAIMALSLAGSERASAEHRCRSGYRNYSSPRVSVSVGYGGYSGLSPGYSVYGYSGFGGVPAYGGHSHRVWHDTSHYDYHGPSMIRHGNHYDFVPGHFDLHRTGHWHHLGHH